MTRGQQAYFLEHEGVFAKSINEIDIDIKEETSNYNYSIKVTPISAFNYANARREYVRKGWFHKIPVIGYVSAIFIVPSTKNELTTLVIICQNRLPGTIHLSDPIYQNGVLTCGPGTIKLQ
ncbi:MAG: type IV pilin-like G/H family protein [Nostoc sp.]|uniref:type IV pilin-like G/H family protein n=1 Tax=Nostoc sp. TaxID=1180 RepID=UPI002FF7F978